MLKAIREGEKLTGVREISVDINNVGQKIRNSSGWKTRLEKLGNLLLMSTMHCFLAHSPCDYASPYLLEADLEWLL